MQGLDHFKIPAGNHGIRVSYGIEKIAHYSRIDTRHITRGDKQHVTVCCQRPCVQSADRTDAPADVGNAADTVQVAEPFALFGILRHEYDLVNDLLKGINEPLNKGPALVDKEVLLLSISTAGFPSYENNR